MPIIAKDNRKEFTPAPEGLQQAVCVDVIDLGEQATPWGKKQKVEIRWQSFRVNPETDSRYLITARYTLSLHEQANLRKVLESWRGKPFKPEEVEDGFDLEKLIGANCQIQVIHKLSQKGHTFGNVQNIVPRMKGPKIEPEDYVRHQDYEENEIGPPASDADESVPF